MTVWIIERQIQGLLKEWQFYNVAESEDAAREMIDIAIANDRWRDDDDFRYAEWKVWTLEDVLGRVRE